MKFVSYAQNFEDVMLWRALKHVEKGFYIDVGAWSPDTDSVTRAFYQRGWHGINIEPNPKFYKQLCDKRPLDTNLQVAISDSCGSTEIHLVSNPGLSTLDQAIAAQHREAGWDSISLTVNVTTLNETWNEYISTEQPVHFLKIDVEGYETQALNGLDLQRLRPWIIVIESTLPMSPIESFNAWEGMLLSNKYLFAYADGLNRFYVAAEQRNLLSTFKYPPNVFDNFEISPLHETNMELSQAYSKLEAAQLAITETTKKIEAQQRKIKEKIYIEKKLSKTLSEEINENKKLSQALSEAERKSSEFKHQAHHTREELNNIYNSKSWRITFPLRYLSLQRKLIVELGLKSRIKSLILRILKNSIPIYFLKKLSNQKKTKKAIRLITRKLGIESKAYRLYVTLLTSRVSTQSIIKEFNFNNNKSHSKIFMENDRKLSTEEILSRVRSEIKAMQVEKTHEQP